MSFTITESPRSKRGGSGSKIHHYPVPQEYQEMADKYERLFRDRPFSFKLVDPADFEAALDAYASNPEFDIYTLTEIFKCSRQTIYSILSSQEYAQSYESARDARAERYCTDNYKYLYRTYIDSRNGDVGRETVNAAKNLANYALAMAQMISPRYSKRGEDGNLNVQINVPKFNIGEEHNDPVDVEAEVLDGKGTES